MYHEFDHAYYENGALISSAPQQVASVPIDVGGNKTTLKFDTLKDENLFEHLLIHDDVVRAYGHDNTDGIEEVQDPHTADTTPQFDNRNFYDNGRSTPLYPSWTPTFPPLNESCK